MAAPSTDEIYETTLQTQDIVATRLVEAPVRVEIDVSQRTVHGQASLGYIYWWGQVQFWLDWWVSHPQKGIAVNVNDVHKFSIILGYPDGGVHDTIVRLSWIHGCRKDALHCRCQYHKVRFVLIASLPVNLSAFLPVRLASFLPMCPTPWPPRLNP